MKRTPLFPAHQKLGARLIEFGGWEMPVFYTSITEEHLATRRAGGLFDISHMGEFLVSGPAAAEFLNFVLTNDIGKLRPGLGQYTLLCRETGGVVDDLYAYQLADAEFLLIVNASRLEDDFAWLQKQWRGWTRRAEVKLENLSEKYGAVAVQGPKVAQFIDQVAPATGLKKNEVAPATFHGETGYVSRTGYTGEDGFEIVAPASVIEGIWHALLEAGRPHGLKPAGLGARDTLRTEVCYPLYGQELDENTTPLEAGLGFFVALDKPNFIGKDALLAQKAAGPTRKLAAFKMQGRCAPPRPGYPIWTSGSSGPIGVVTSGTQSPSLNLGIGLGYVAQNFSVPNTAIEIEIRGQRAPALVAPRPLYKSSPAKT
ncbi:MAG TPA: glycine cleavage system aminomethyltransferase GcvT [Verrucomicrobiae bacterium]|jgi:aminomethyltransferase|nr:glycine cleavage system aminomethyltransferase GcvT [Verrucomicrobiae bacterium]